MAKRFTNSDKWKTPFLRSLKAPYKLLWLYILDECDHAGIWQVDFEIAEIKIGETLYPKVAIEQFGEKIKIFDNGEKWFVPEFIEFQYGTLNPGNRAHLSVINLLEKLKINFENKPLISPLQGAKDKDMVKDMDTDKVGGVGEKTFNNENLENVWKSYLEVRKEKGKTNGDISINQLLKKLNTLSGGKDDVKIEILQQSVIGGYYDLFMPRQVTKSNVEEYVIQKKKIDNSPESKW